MMADQQVVVILYFSSSLEKLFFLNLRNFQFLNKVSSLIHFHYFSRKHSLLALSFSIFKKILKNEVQKLLKCSLPAKTF